MKGQSGHLKPLGPMWALLWLSISARPAKEALQILQENFLAGGALPGGAVRGGCSARTRGIAPASVSCCSGGACQARQRTTGHWTAGRGSTLTCRGESHHGHGGAPLAERPRRADTRPDKRSAGSRSEPFPGREPQRLLGDGGGVLAHLPRRRWGLLLLLLLGPL